MKAIKDLQRRITELEKNFKLLSGTINIDQMNLELKKINDILLTKANDQDLIDLKDLYSKSNK